MAHNFIDLAGQCFGRLTVVSRAENNGTRAQWMCRCDCGNTSIVVGKDLRNGRTKSCGCLSRDTTSKLNIIDINGWQFGRLTVIGRSSNGLNGKARWICRCDCGTEHTTTGDALHIGDTKSCGCLKRDMAGTVAKTHGYARTPTYQVWCNMKARCSNPTADRFPIYGGRGIRICERWLRFENFLADMGEKPARMTLDRKDSDGNYEPDNCRWADLKTQANNVRRNRLITYGGETLTMQQWAERTGIRSQKIRDRLDKLGWSIERALLP